MHLTLYQELHTKDLEDKTSRDTFTTPGIPTKDVLGSVLCRDVKDEYNSHHDGWTHLQHPGILPVWEVKILFFK